MSADEHAPETTPLGDVTGTDVTNEKWWKSRLVSVVWTSEDEVGLGPPRHDPLPAFEPPLAPEQTRPGRPTRSKNRSGGKRV